MPEAALTHQNRFREIINAFMFSQEDKFRERLISRLRNILELEESLGKLLRQAPKYAPIEFHTTAPVSTISNKSSTQIISSPVAQESQETATSEQLLEQKAPKMDHKSNTTKFKSVDELRPYMRAFHVSLYAFLIYT